MVEQKASKINLKELAVSLVKSYSVGKFRETVLQLHLSMEEIEELEEEIKKLDYTYWIKLMGDIDLDDDREEFDDTDYITIPEYGYDPEEENE